ncbi:hypothetical protein C8R43DRAFT_948606 [Mycena crocata]|nr:hypothetical protein C8R43DRAFT_948606 [Mycena crocata]
MSYNYWAAWKTGSTYIIARVRGEVVMAVELVWDGADGFSRVCNALMQTEVEIQKGSDWVVEWGCWACFEWMQMIAETSDQCLTQKRRVGSPNSRSVHGIIQSPRISVPLALTGQADGADTKLECNSNPVYFLPRHVALEAKICSLKPGPPTVIHRVSIVRVRFLVTYVLAHIKIFDLNWCICPSALGIGPSGLFLSLSRGSAPVWLLEVSFSWDLGLWCPKGQWAGLVKSPASRYPFAELMSQGPIMEALSEYPPAERLGLVIALANLYRAWMVQLFDCDVARLLAGQHINTK